MLKTPPTYILLGETYFIVFTCSEPVIVNPPLSVSVTIPDVFIFATRFTADPFTLVNLPPINKLELSVSKVKTSAFAPLVPSE